MRRKISQKKVFHKGTLTEKKYIFKQQKRGEKVIKLLSFLNSIHCKECSIHILMIKVTLNFVLKLRSEQM